MKKYDHTKIEKKWQKEWDKADIYEAKDKSPKKKFYPLVEFPFPSGSGLHTGHIRSYTAMDAVARKRRMQGENVLYPIGWDAFGLPTENYAIKTGRQPKDVTKENTDTFRKQLKSLGLSFDWSREINTTDPAYYKWTQWIFLKMYENGLAFKARSVINWCPKDKIGLANEEVVNGCCERCGAPVEKREKEQWMLAITKYAERLLSDLDSRILPNGDLFWVNEKGEPGITHMNTDVPGKVRQDKKFVERQAACAFVEHWEGGKFIVLKWKKVDWMTPITGGVEKGQTVEEAARAEVREETGFKNLDLVRRSEGQYHSTFFQVPKDENRVGHFTSFHFKLKDGICDEVIADEQAKHEVLWVSKDKVRETMTAEGSKLGWDLAIDGTVRHETKPLLDWPESIKEAQRNWIGRSEGMLFTAPVKDTELKIQTFSAHFEAFRADTFVVIAPDHPFLSELIKGTPKESAVLEFARNLVSKRNVEGYDQKEPEGIFTGRFIVDPVGNGDLPIWVASYALADYGTGIVKCSCHDERDFAFAKKYGIQMKPVLFPDDEALAREIGKLEVCYTDMKKGRLSEPKEFKGKIAGDSRKDIIAYLETNNLATKKTTYRIKDWIFSRQRYWGEPIPMIKCPSCGWVPVPEKDLPVTLPAVKKYEPTDTGESPLSAISSWVNVKCPKCKGEAQRETDVMPNWAGSSWYYLRYIDPKNKKALADKEKLEHFMPVDWYNGGREHTTLHLLYSRFWHKFLFDIGSVNTVEPYKKRTSHGMILAEGGEKMSKSKGNVVNPDGLIKTFGADTLRVYEMFMGPFEQAIAWDSHSLIGPRRFIERIFGLSQKISAKKGEQLGQETEALLHKTIKKVSSDIEAMGFNTAISALMILTNALEKEASIPRSDFEILLKLLAPFAPHLAEELWAELGNKKSIHISDWPVADESKLVESTVTIVVQVNGKVRASFAAAKGTAKETLEKSALNLDDVKKWIGNKSPEKVIVVQDKLVSIVIK